MVGEGERQKRQIACKARVKEILSGRYVKEDGWMPNYVETVDGRKISRINIIGAVVASEEEKEIGYNSIVIDDGTGKVSVRVFGDDADKLKGIGVGDVVLIIGRPREYGAERYVLLEIIKKIDDKKWIDVRKLELGATAIDKVEEKPEEELKEEAIEEGVVGGEEMTAGDKIVDYIRKVDKGDGVDIEEVLKEFGDENAIKTLLSEGELFEVKPGRIKVLE